MNSSRPPAPAFFLPAVILPQGDNSFLVRPGKPVSWLSTSAAAQILGVSTSTIYRLIDAGHIKADRPSPHRIRIHPASLQQHLHNTQDPQFWES